MDAGVHLPLIDFGGEGFSYRRLTETVDAARACGFGAVSANDHFLFSRPWLDGLTALAAVAGRSGGMTLVTTVALAALRGPVPLAKALSALDVLSGGRVIAGVGPGSSKADYDAAGVPFEQRWQRFDDTLPLIRALLQPATAGGAGDGGPAAGCSRRRGKAAGSRCGSGAGAPGLACAALPGPAMAGLPRPTTPPRRLSRRPWRVLGGELESRQRPSGGFPNALVTMWAWITGSRSEADRVLSEVVAPLVRRDPAELRGRICVGSAGECAELLSRYARAGCQRVHFWPVGDERRQIELIAGEVMPHVSC